MEEKKIKVVRRPRAARNHFDADSSISLDTKEFSTPEQSKKIEEMLKDYVASQEALTDLATKLWQLKSDVMLIDSSVSNQSPTFSPEPFGVGKLAKFLMQEITLAEKIKQLNTSLICGGRQSTT